jgi:plastocyanin
LAPFLSKTETGTENSFNEETNNGTSIGSISWTPTSSGTYYYQCSLDVGMIGVITIN